MRAINGQLQSLGLEPLRVDDDSRYVLVAPSALEDVQQKVLDKVRGRVEPDSPAERVLSAISVLQAAYGARATAPSGRSLVRTFGNKRFQEIAARIIKNSYKADIHFLPADAQRSEWSAIREPSVALFRYPISIPLELLDSAQDTCRPDWTAEVERLSECIPCAPAFAKVRPMKRLTLRSRFLGDLLTRYLSIYIRLGSPDFTDEAVTNYLTQIQEM